MGGGVKGASNSFQKDVGNDLGPCITQPPNQNKPVPAVCLLPQVMKPYPRPPPPGTPFSNMKPKEPSNPKL